MCQSSKTLNLRNIGAKTEHLLFEIGIHSYRDLVDMGSLEAYRRLKDKYPGSISLNALYALEAAIWDIHWLELHPAIREELKRQVRAMDGRSLCTGQPHGLLSEKST